jgi:hypothetical protein
MILVNDTPLFTHDDEDDEEGGIILTTWDVTACQSKERYANSSLYMEAANSLSPPCTHYPAHVGKFNNGCVTGREIHSGELMGNHYEWWWLQTAAAYA